MKKMEMVTGTISNTCSCTEYDDATGEYTDEPATECYGCWELDLEMFEQDIEELRDNNDTNLWRVENIQLWDRRVSGIFPARTVLDIVRGMTVRGEWTMRYAVFSDRIEYSLSHHDAPMGSNSTLRAVTDEQREEMGLY